MYYVARRLGETVDAGCLMQAAIDWMQLGVAVLKNGADPSSIAKLELGYSSTICLGRFDWLEWELTPLLHCIDVWNWSVVFGSLWSLKSILKRIRIWAGMMQQAGIDLCQYGAQEREVWTNLPKAQPSWRLDDCTPWQSWIVSGLVYGSTPEQWSLRVQSSMTDKCQVFELGSLPGSFPSTRKYLPTTIIWKPTFKEDIEGPWLVKESSPIRPHSIDLRELISVVKREQEQNDVYVKHVNRIQNDHGPVCMMQYQAMRERPTRRRSHSQPAPISLHANSRYIFATRRTASRRSWIPPYHKCPHDSKWGFWCGCSLQWFYYWSPALSGCVEGILDGLFSVQESRKWQYRSFLAEISKC